MKDTETLSFLDRIIHLSLMTPDVSSPLEDAKLVVDEKGEYNLFFTEKALSQEKVVIHEVWHLFFDILSTFDEREVLFKDLRKDIYAYSFATLFSKIKEGLTLLC